MNQAPVNAPYSGSGGSSFTCSPSQSQLSILAFSARAEPSTTSHAINITATFKPTGTAKAPIVKNTIAATSTTSYKPFFQDPSSLTPVPTPPDDGRAQSNALAKAVLEYAVIAVAIAGVALVVCLVLQRYATLKRRNQPLYLFFARTRPARTTTTSPTSPSFQPPNASSNQPTARFPRTTGLTASPPYPSTRDTRAMDTDASGRRLNFTNNATHSEHDAYDAYLGDKDVLPAYESAGSPPEYDPYGSSARQMGVATRGPVRLAEESARMNETGGGERDVERGDAPRLRACMGMGGGGPLDRDL